MQDLSRDERLLLLRFVCSFAWADREVVAEERDFVRRLVERLELDADERRQVATWLDVPPPPEAVDPRLVPQAHRTTFVRAVESVIAADGKITPSEREQLMRLVQGLRATASE